MDSCLTGYRRPGKMHPCTAFPVVQEPGGSVSLYKHPPAWYGPVKTNPSEACSLGLHIDPSDQDRVMMLLTGV